MERMFIVIAIIGIVYLIARDAVDLFRSRERGMESKPDVEPQFRHFNPDQSSPAMDYGKLGLAYLIDLLPFVVLLLIVHTMIVPLDRIGQADISAGPDGVDSLMNAMFALIAILMSFTVSKVLHVLLVAKTQRSLGWYLTGYRVTDEDDGTPRMWDYVTRSIDHTPMRGWNTESPRRSSSSRIRYVAKDCKLVKA